MISSSSRFGSSIVFIDEEYTQELNEFAEEFSIVLKKEIPEIDQINEEIIEVKKESNGVMIMKI